MGWGWGGFQEPGVPVGVKDALGPSGCVSLYGRLELVWKAGEGPGHGAGAGLSRPPSPSPQHSSPLLTSHCPPASPKTGCTEKGSVGGPVWEPKRTGGRGQSWQGPDLLAFRGSRGSFPPHGSQPGTLESHCHLLAPQFGASLGLVCPLPAAGQTGVVGWSSSGQGPGSPALGYLTRGSRMKSWWAWEDLVNHQDGQGW